MHQKNLLHLPHSSSVLTASSLTHGAQWESVEAHTLSPHTFTFSAFCYSCQIFSNLERNVNLLKYLCTQANDGIINISIINTVQNHMNYSQWSDLRVFSLQFGLFSPELSCSTSESCRFTITSSSLRSEGSDFRAEATTSQSKNPLAGILLEHILQN